MHTSVACRACGIKPLRSVVSLGRTPLANALVTADRLGESEDRYDLDVVFCPGCSLVQITETVPPEKLFAHYAYFSSYSDTILAGAKRLAERLTAERGLGGTSLVMEIASNDGYLLQHYRDLGVAILGIEPARNVARVAEERGIPTRCEFFGAEFAETLVGEGRHADVFHANNVLAHVADLNGVVAGIARVLDPRGVASIEVPYVRDLVDHCEFDTIYHEHLCYFSLTALDRLFASHGLCVADVEHLEIHGGSLRVFVVHAGASAPSDALTRLLESERTAGVTSYEYYRDFARRIESLRGQLLALLHRLKAAGHRLAAYGASAKGSTLLNVFGIGHELLDFVVDRSPIKQGLFTPGTHLPILSPDALRERRPDYVLLLTWNFADEILAQQHAFRAEGGRFIIPVPIPRIV